MDNGHQPDPLQALRDYAEQVAVSSRAHAEQLEVELQSEQRLQTEIKSLLEQSRDRERGMRKAVEALTGERTEPVKRGSTRAASGANWTISQKKVQEVWDVILQQGGQFKPTELREQGLSGEAVRRSIIVLRNQELIRVAGSLRGGGKLYDLMPGAAEHTTITVAPGDDGHGDSSSALWNPGNGA